MDSSSTADVLTRLLASYTALYGTERSADRAVGWLLETTAASIARVEQYRTAAEPGDD